MLSKPFLSTDLWRLREKHFSISASPHSFPAPIESLDLFTPQLVFFVAQSIALLSPFHPPLSSPSPTPSLPQVLAPYRGPRTQLATDGSVVPTLFPDDVAPILLAARRHKYVKRLSLLFDDEDATLFFQVRACVGKWVWVRCESKFSAINCDLCQLFIHYFRTRQNLSSR